MKNIERTLGLMIAWSLVVSLFGQAWAGETIDIWSKGAGARPMGMGQAAVADPQQVFAAFWNPAGLAAVDRLALASQYASLFQVVSHYGLAVATPLMGGAVGLGYINESTGDIPLTSLGPDGRPVLSGSFSDVKDALGLSYGQAILTPGLSAGATIKYYRETLYDQKAAGYGLDLGLIYLIPGTELSLGLTGRNIMRSALVWPSGASDALGRRLAGGLSYTGEVWDKPVLLSMDLEAASAKQIKAFYGLEVAPLDMLAIRAGLADGNFTTGLGLKFGQFTLNYAFGAHSDLEASHQFSISWNEGPAGFVQAPQPRVSEARAPARSPAVQDNKQQAQMIEIESHRTVL